ncbi:MAG: His-Xaa-Ser system radical SAM maturase HxsC [Terracidiphilus sp.]|jgi:His-Xaa-Ser system radical SAM maturase HxsC
MRLTTTGVARNFDTSIIGTITTSDLPHDKRTKRIRFLAPSDAPMDDAIVGYRALLCHDELARDPGVPYVHRLRESDHLRDGDIVVLEGRAGLVRSLYRPYELHHHLFVTERCNSNCLMCSQPPKDKDDVEALTERNLELISLIEPHPPYLTITGGEPTLLGDHLFRLISQLKLSMPETELHMLTNGRTFAWPEYARRFAEVEHPKVSLGIPLYADYAGAHDYVVQAKGAFDQTVAGLHQAARNGIRLEVRVVLHKLTIPRIAKLVDYIYRNLTFVEHIALMGLEYTGYTPRNIEELWIDPYDYQDVLEEAVEYLAVRNMTVSIYNHQLCVLRPSLWRYARKSISDWKTLYLPECETCSALPACGGLFQWAVKKHSDHIHSISLSQPSAAQKFL